MGIVTVSVKILSSLNGVSRSFYFFTKAGCRCLKLKKPLKTKDCQADSPPLKVSSHFPVMSLKRLSESSAACPCRQVRDGRFLQCRQIFVGLKRQVNTAVTR